MSWTLGNMEGLVVGFAQQCLRPFEQVRAGNGELLQRTAQLRTDDLPQ